MIRVSTLISAFLCDFEVYSIARLAWRIHAQSPSGLLALGVSVLNDHISLPNFGLVM